MTPVERLRFEAGETQEEVAAASGVSVSTIVRLERGSRPSAKVAKALADHFDVSIAELIPVEREAA